MMILLLLAVVGFYAGYNLLIKISSDAASGAATTTVLATITLQCFALIASFVFATVLIFRGGERFDVGSGALVWAALAGLCIGAAEVVYFYLFRGFGEHQALPANLVIPIVVAGSVLITVILSIGLFRESVTLMQGMGLALIAAGTLLLLGSAR